MPGVGRNIPKFRASNLSIMRATFAHVPPLLTVFIAVAFAIPAFDHAAAQNQAVNDEWVTVHVCHLSLLLPKDLKRTDIRGIDSCMAEFTNQKIRLYLDYGYYSGPKVKSERDVDFKEQSILIDGKTARVATYNDDTTYSGGKKPYLRYFANLYVIINPGGAEFRSRLVSLEMNVGCESESDQEIGLRIFRSIRFE
jgi:hypothetical protein